MSMDSAQIKKRNEIDKQSKRVMLASMIGNILEWYEFVIYGFLACIFGKLFFPIEDETLSLLYSLGAFGAGFVMRPIGAIVFGHIGDKFGRKRLFVLATYLMIIPTSLIAFLPTYEHIGIAAPILLILMRLLQGFSMGGEHTGSIVFIVEHAPENKKCFIGSLSILSLVLGTLAGSVMCSLITYLISEENLVVWGWRIPFLLSAFGGLNALYLLSLVKDDIETKKEKHFVPLFELFKNYKKGIMSVILVDMLVAVGFFIISILIPSYMTSTFKIQSSASLFISTISMTCMAIAIIFSGWLGDKIKRRSIMLAASSSIVVIALPLIKNFSSDSLYVVGLSSALLAATFGVYFAPIAATITSFFPKDVRCSGVSISHNLSMTIFGGTMPVFTIWLQHTTGYIFFPALCLMGAAAISFVGLFFIKSMKNQN